ncbi:MAG: ATP-binding protein [Candidatus Manganitrophus sp. SB1]|nr:ATP-binding protein [Candidatus Manganitrophus morganii]
MPKNLSLNEIRSLLDSGDFNKFIGTVEDAQLECKDAPYQIGQDHQKQEFAKDISGLANADGGFVLLGVKTERHPTHLGDEITTVNPFIQSLVNQDQYHKILQSWIYPPLQQVDIRWFPSGADKEKGVVAIHVPSQASTRRPFLITRTIDSRGKQIEIVFGYVERRRDNIPPTSVQELHSLIRDGLRFDSLDKKYNEIQETLQQLMAGQSQKANITLQQNIQELLDDRRNEALIAVDLQTQPIFILAATPIEAVDIPTLFQASDAEIVRLLKNPPELRPSGFDLTIGETPKIVRGQLRRAVNPKYRILDLWRNGTLIFATRGDEEFLSWGRPRGALRINPLVLAESTYLFAELNRQVSANAQPHPQSIEYRLELLNMTRDGMPCGLIPGPIGTFGWEFGTDIRNAPDSQVTITKRSTDLDPGIVAFDLISELYGWFGLEQDKIPYTERKNGRLVISPDQIRRAGAG